MISGIVVTLSSQAELARAAVATIDQHRALEMGLQEKRRLPLVLETTTASESQSHTDWLGSLPGVDFVDVVFVHLDEIQTDESVPAPQPLSNESSLRN